jgi:hypothetical protein
MYECISLPEALVPILSIVLFKLDVTNVTFLELFSAFPPLSLSTYELLSIIVCKALSVTEHNSL